MSQTALNPRLARAETTRVPVALVVDDDPVILLMAETVLTDEGFKVVTATTAIDAMAQVRITAIDLLLVDLSLPDMGGYDLLAGIRRLNLASGARVVVVSGRDDEQALTRGRELGIDDYIVKPLNVVDLVNLARTTRAVF